MKQVELNEEQTKELIKKLEYLEWEKLPRENSDKFVDAFAYDGNVFKIYEIPNSDMFKVYYNSTPYFNYLKKYDDLEKFKRFLRHFEGRRVIEIDDAGIGCPLGGVIICVYSRYKDLASLKVIGLKYFQKPLYQTKQYLKEVTRRIFWTFKELEVKKDYFIRICPGDIFVDAIDTLWRRGFNLITTRRIEMAHVIAETRFLKYLRDIGIPDEILDVNPRNIDYAAFHKAINDYIRENTEIKKFFFKTGWFKK